MCQSAWDNPLSWGCPVVNAWNGLTSAFNQGAHAFFIAMFSFVLSIFKTLVFSIAYAITGFITGSLNMMVLMAAYLGPMSLPAFAALFVLFFTTVYMVAGVFKEVPVAGALE
jgi:hypothetical protein